MKIIKMDIAASIIASILLVAAMSNPPLVVAQATESSKDLIATGSFADDTFTIVSSKTIGGVTYLAVTGSGTVTGTLTGTYVFVGIIEVYSTGDAIYHVIDKCKCTVAGKSGLIFFNEQGQGNFFTGDFQANLDIIYTTDGLKDLSGTGTLQGKQDTVTLLTSGTYSMNLTFG